MITLIKYEFLKIAKRRSTLAVMLISLIITAFMFGLPVLQFQTYDKEDVRKGIEGIRYERSIKDGIDVTLTDEYVETVIDEVNGLFEDPANIGTDGSERFLTGDAYWDHIAPREKLVDTIASAYTKPGEYAGYNRCHQIWLPQRLGDNTHQLRASDLRGACVLHYRSTCFRR